MSLPEFQVCENDITEEILTAYLADPVLAVDTEAMGLLPHRDRLCTIQLSNAVGQTVVVRFARGFSDAPNLKTLLEASQTIKTFHYARFDIAMLLHHFGIRTQPLFCTKIASKIARTYTDKHGLKDVVLDLCGIELDKTAQSSDWGAVQELSETQLRYAANDVRYLIPLRARLIHMLKREERLHLAEACFTFLPTRAELDLFGYSDILKHH
ncbi:MAG: ribonuclease H-like domain-containing protein [Cyanobacteria bacterium P01_D01_bin.123]